MIKRGKGWRVIQKSYINLILFGREIVQACEQSNRATLSTPMVWWRQPHALIPWLIRIPWGFHDCKGAKLFSKERKREFVLLLLWMELSLFVWVWSWTGYWEETSFIIIYKLWRTWVLLKWFALFLEILFDFPEFWWEKSSSNQRNCPSIKKTWEHGSFNEWAHVANVSGGL